MSNLTAIGKNDVNILMEDGRFSDFKKGNTYRCLLKGDKAVLMDENKTGFMCDMIQFEENFELV